MPVNCKKCGTTNEEGGKFCASCGAALASLNEAPVVQTSSPQASAISAKTMLFNKAPQVSKVKPAAASPKSSAPKGTILGAPAVQLPQKQKPTEKSAPKAAPMINVGAAKPAVVAQSKTASTSKPVSASPKEPPPGVGERAKTVIGLPAADAGEVAAAIEAAKKATAKPAPAANVSPATQQTATVVAEPSGPQEPHKHAPKGASSGKAAQPAPSTAKPEPAESAASSLPAGHSSNAPAAANISAVPSAPPPDTMSADDWPDAAAEEPKSSAGTIIAIVLAAVVIVGLAGFIIYKFVLTSAPSFQPQILASQDGETLTVILDLPDVAAGSSIQYSNQSIPVAGGKVQFLLQKKQMVLGANLVKVMLSEPGGAQEEIAFPIMLRHLATNDFRKLSEASPSIDVRFKVAEGFSIKVNKTPCPLEDGVCIFNLAANVKPNQTAKTLQYAIPFELIDAAGNSDPGQHIVTVPVTQFHIDRPAKNAVVDSEEITVAGTVVPGTVVRVNGNKIKSGDTGFSTTVPIPTIGVNKINVTAAAPNSAPSIKELIITRVDDLTPHVESWSEDLDKSFNFAKLSRDTDTHAGKKIHLSGRIININTERGVTAFLMYVDKGCPRGGQCGIYVVFRGETEAGLQSMVDVYGIVRGTHDVAFASGTQKTLPAIDAAYVIAEEQKEK